MNINNFNLSKPKHQKNRNITLIIGVLLFSLGIFDFSLNNFQDKNITFFLPGLMSFLSPLIFAVLGFVIIYYIKS